MIVFRNPGLIDLDAVRTMGVSVKLPGSFGFFGTGMKFAIATILRGRGSVVIYRGKERHELHTVPKTIRGVEFQVVHMDGQPLGVTDQLGKNWEPWMALRELGCNALDDKGLFFKVLTAPADPYAWYLPDAPELWQVGGEEDTTTIVVDWDKMDQAFDKRDEIFFGDRPVVLRNERVEVAAGRSNHVFYRGVRALKLEHPSAFTYNVVSEQTLTEDRTLAGEWNVRGPVRNLWLTCEDPVLLQQAIVLGPDDYDCYEQHVDYDSQYEYGSPSKAFLDVCYDARSKKLNLAKGAEGVFQKHIRKSTEAGGYSSSRRMEDAFSLALEAVEEMFERIIPKAEQPEGKDYVDWVEDPLGAQKAQFVMVEDLPEGRLSLYEDGRIYISRQLLRERKRTIAAEIIRRLLESGYLDVTETLLPLVLQNHSYTRVGLDLRKAGPEPQEDDDPAAEHEEMTDELALEYAELDDHPDKISHDQKVAEEQAGDLF